MAYKFCVWCGTTKNLTWEHVIPIGLGGLPYQSNLRKACLSCNHERGRVTDDVKYGRESRIATLLRKWVELEQCLLGFSPHEEFVAKRAGAGVAGRSEVGRHCGRKHGQSR